MIQEGFGKFFNFLLSISWICLNSRQHLMLRSGGIKHLIPGETVLRSLWFLPCPWRAWWACRCCRSCLCFACFPQPQPSPRRALWKRWCRTVQIPKKIPSTWRSRCLAWIHTVNTLLGTLWRSPILQTTCPYSCLMALVGTEPRRVRPRQSKLQPANWRSMQDTSMFTQVPALATLCHMATYCRQCQDRRAMWTLVWRTGTSSSDMLMLPEPATSRIWCPAWDGWCTRDATWSERSGNVPTGPWRHQARVAKGWGTGYIVIILNHVCCWVPCTKGKHKRNLSPEAKPTSPKWPAALPLALTKRAGSSLFRCHGECWKPE